MASENSVACSQKKTDDRDSSECSARASNKITKHTSLKIQTQALDVPGHVIDIFSFFACDLSRHRCPSFNFYGNLWL